MLYDVTSIKEVLTEFFKAIFSENNISSTLSIFLLILIILSEYIKSKEKIYILKNIVPVFIIIILFFLCDNKTLFVCLSLCSAILLDIFYFYCPNKNTDTKKEENTFISNDNPIMNNKQDFLGRDKFIEDLKHTLINYSENFNKEGIVLTLSADWGEGKTSCINLLKNSLQKENFQFIDINPWFNDSKDKVLNAIFGELNHFAKINPPYQSLEKEFDEIIKLSKINFNGIIGNIELALDKFTQNKNIKTKIEEVGKILKRYSKKIIIVIDDIDRLDKTHILYILQVVQMFRQYTNIIFILSCNCEKVEEILCEMSEPCTNINDNNKLQTTNMIKKTVYYRDYLEKISTITIKLPKINHFYIHNYLKETILNILQKLDDKNKENFKEQFDRYIVTSRFKTIRDVKRFYNTFIAAYSQPKFRDSIDIFNYINLTTLQLFYPDLYKDAYINRYQWCDKWYYDVLIFQKLDSDRKYFENLVFNYDKYDKQMALELISVVSPVYHKLIKNSNTIEKTKIRLLSADNDNSYFKNKDKYILYFENIFNENLQESKKDEK